jgi:hypothetical protein
LSIIGVRDYGRSSKDIKNAGKVRRGYEICDGAYLLLFRKTF